MYTLAGLANDETGWGVRDETWSAAWMLGRYGEPTWFRLGDRDLATHIVRTRRLGEGARLTDVTAEMARALEITGEPAAHDRRPSPNSDPDERRLARVPGLLRASATTRTGFSRCTSTASPRRNRRAEVLAAIAAADVIVIAPSNPFLSVAPILSVPGMLDALHAGDGAGHRRQPDRRRRGAPWPGGAA